ncbi:hypothetical protein MMC32_005344 [Xylographa parallela]|nr:hypothetical protein [Xylographa parallela]
MTSRESLLARINQLPLRRFPGLILDTEEPMSEEAQTLTREQRESKLEREAIAKQKAAEEAERAKTAQEKHEKEGGRTG